MHVLVDTPVWSALFRRSPKLEIDPLVSELQELVSKAGAILIGPIRQEVLSGIRDHHQFQSLRKQLQAFPNFSIDTEDHESAAELFNLCRSKGVQGSHTDFLLCALSQRHQMSIFTTDHDFDTFSKHIKIHLHKPPTAPTSAR